MRTSPIQRFIDAFNARDLPAMEEVLAPDATAQVVAAPFPVEQGAPAIMATSIPYLLDSELHASAADVEEAPGILLRAAAGSGPIDVAIQVIADANLIARLDYITGPHQPERLRALGAALGIATTESAP